MVAGTELLPDLPATALFTAAVALTLAIREGLLTRWRPLWLVVVGVLLGWSYLTREFIVFVWPLVVRPAVAAGRPVGVALGVRARWRSTGLGEMALNAHLYGDPLKRLHAGPGSATCPRARRSRRPSTTCRSGCTCGGCRSSSLSLAEGRALLLLLALTLAAGVVVVVRRMRGTVTVPERRVGRVRAVVRAAVGAAHPGRRCARPAHPKLRLQLLRYWYPRLPAFVLGGVAALWLAARALRLPERLADRLPDRRRASWPRGPSCVALAIVGLAVIRPARQARLGGLPPGTSDALPEFRSWLSRSDAQTVWADDEAVPHPADLFVHAGGTPYLARPHAAPDQRAAGRAGRLRGVLQRRQRRLPALRRGGGCSPDDGPAGVAAGHDEPRPPPACLAGRVRSAPGDGRRRTRRFIPRDRIRGTFVRAPGRASSKPRQNRRASPGWWPVPYGPSVRRAVSAAGGVPRISRL